MTNRTLAKVTSNLARTTNPPVQYQTVTRLSKLSSMMEPLESRTMMSVAHAPVVVHAKAPAKTKTTVPTLVVPSTLAITAPSATNVKVTWTDSDTTATGYKLLRSTNGGSFAQVSQITTRTTFNYVDTAVSPNTTYSYEVQAYNTTLTSTDSSKVTIKTPLAAPTGLTATAQTGTKMVLAWTDNDHSAAGYYVLRSTNGAAFTTLTTLKTASAATFTDNTVSSGQSYRYEVQAYQGTNTSAVSAVTTGITPLAAPAGLAAIVESSSWIHLTWTAKDSSATGYLILRSTNGTTYSNVGSLASATPAAFDDKTALPSTTYYYEVQAAAAATISPVSNIASATTPLAIPTGTTAVATGPTSIKLTWTDTDAAAQGYVILRSTNGSAYTQAGLISSRTTTTWTDNNVTADTTYAYEVEANHAATYSAPTSPVAVTTPMSTPTGLTATALGQTSIKLTWTNTDPTATQYIIMRSVNGSTFATLATVTGGTTTTYTDTTDASGHSYSYDVLAATTTRQSGTSAIATAVTPLAAPSGLNANAASGTSVMLTWTDNDPNATGYNILRSTDGITFTQLAQLNSPTAQAYTDQNVTAGHKYYYQVQAVASGVTSPMSAIASATITAPAPSTSTVIISTRNTNELVITLTGADDTLSVTQSGSTLTIIADGKTTTQPAPTAGLFIYTRGGLDNISVGQSVTVRTTVETIDAAVDDISTLGTNVSVWDDSTDIYTGDATVHTVNTFAGGVTKAAGASLKDPSDAGTIMHVTGSLWGTGPVAADVNQGDVGDCYFLSSLAAFAGQNPKLLQESAVDMGDGTYTVQFITSNGSPEFVRVSNDISTYGSGTYVYARPGTDGDLWAVIMEKAYTYFRTGANTYNSINSGWMGDVYSALGVNSNFFIMSNMTASTLASTLTTALAAGKEVTLGTDSSAPNLVSGHAYTLISCSTDANGNTTYVVRNPWGVQGDSLENSQGYATLTFAQMYANFYDGCVAT